VVHKARTLLATSFSVAPNLRTRYFYLPALVLPAPLHIRCASLRLHPPHYATLPFFFGRVYFCSPWTLHSGRGLRTQWTFRTLPDSQDGELHLASSRYAWTLPADEQTIPPPADRTSGCGSRRWVGSVMHTGSNSQLQLVPTQRWTVEPTPFTLRAYVLRLLHTVFGGYSAYHPHLAHLKFATPRTAHGGRDHCRGWF